MINKIMKENVLLNFNVDINQKDKWGKDKGISIDTYKITIPVVDIKGEISMDELNKEFNSGISDLKMNEGEISMEYFTCETIFLNELKEIYEHVEFMVRNIGQKLDKFKVTNFKIIFDFYIWED